MRAFLIVAGTVLAGLVLVVVVRACAVSQSDPAFQRWLQWDTCVNNAPAGSVMNAAGWPVQCGNEPQP